jgi:hypothetical protein
VKLIRLRDGTELPDPLAVVLGFVDAYGIETPLAPEQASTFGEADLRRANRGGARISAAEIAAVLERQKRIEQALRAIAPGASLAGRVQWGPLTELFEAFADIRGVGFAKTTKTLHPKRPALIPILDSVVQAYLGLDEATALVRAYKEDLDRNLAELREVQLALAERGHRLTEVRILDVLIWSAKTPGVLLPIAP